METIDKLTELLKKYQLEHKTLKSRLNSVERNIKDIAYKIDRLTQKPIYVNPATTLKYRDIDICLSFIKKNRKVTSKQLIDHLNSELIGKDLRWKDYLDSNRFMTYMGKYLKPITINYNSKSEGVSGKRTTVWEYKLNYNLNDLKHV